MKHEILLSELQSVLSEKSVLSRGSAEKSRDDAIRAIDAIIKKLPVLAQKINRAVINGGERTENTAQAARYANDLARILLRAKDDISSF